ncbi:MAG: bifunctional 4-hydroxy-2-oxoglutarate aldolase/2-dehydro-3-deoxy-phosphogluconate aldolase [Planctomycetaceae bacterium]|nr:bifunctional 4-hydroxy-2-oxoglutarate aldolase/2-dehydro-3-deoxy-phosphogluconate aldolase [Planctomycetaceae bacterium]
MLPREMVEGMRRSGIVAVLVIDRAEDAVPLARALGEGGVQFIELTLRTPAALDALRAIRAEMPEMAVGAGTVLTVEQVREVAASGASFAVAPGMNPRVVRAAQDIGLPFMPGVMTPSDVEQALECGCRELKLFPAEPVGGLKYLKNMAAPYAHLNLQFVPLGGLSPANAGAYLADPWILAVGGSWIAKRDVIERRDWATITKNAKEACALAPADRKAK